MSTSENPDPNDPFFFASVPTYVEQLGVDNDDTLGDTWFAMQRSLPSTPERGVRRVQPHQSNANRASSIGSTIPPRPPSRAGQPPNVELEMNMNNNGGPVPRVQAQPRLVRRSMLLVANVRPTTRPSSAAERENNQPEADVQKQPNVVELNDYKLPMPDVTPVRRSVFANANNANAVAKPMMAMTTRSMAANANDERKQLADANTSKLPAIPGFASNKPTIVQPPMSFGNNSRRSVMPPRTPTVGRANAGGVSHGVRGISVTRSSRPTSRLGHAEPEQSQPKEPELEKLVLVDPAQKVPAKPRPVRRSRSATVATKPAVATRSAMAELKQNQQHVVEEEQEREQEQNEREDNKKEKPKEKPNVPKEKQLPVPAVGRVLQAKPRPVRQSIFDTYKPKATSTRADDVKQKGSRASTSSKPALVQPPMRFGKASSSRAMPKWK